MKLLLFIGLLLILSACSNDEELGGRLPVLITDWTGIVETDPLMPINYAGNEEFYFGDFLAVIGDDQPVPAHVAAQMLNGIGFVMEYEGEKMLTLSQAQEIMQRINPAGKLIYLTEENRDIYISYALWVEMFIQLVQTQSDNFGVQASNIVLLGQRDGAIYTNAGTFGGKTINLAGFFDQEIRVLRRDKNILAVLGITDFTPTLKNIKIIHSDAFGVTIFVGGVFRNYVYKAGLDPLDDGVVIANLQINGHEIIMATPAEATITGTIERVRSHAIDLMEWGSIPLCPSFVVYRACGDLVRAGNDVEGGNCGVTISGTQDLLVGANIADFHLISGRIGAAVITRDISPTNIRVAIGTCNFAGLVHDNVTITANVPFTVQTTNGREENFAAGQHFTPPSDLWGGIRLYIYPDCMETGRLEIVGLRRNWPGGQSPLYRGVLEISRYNGSEVSSSADPAYGSPSSPESTGGFLIVNELCIEEYLFAVVPSEMPTAHGLEAAKVQAITARSFALHQIYQNAFRAFGAHVDDSVISQVYNNIPETDISVAAVNATRGLVLKVDGQLVIANYFSTSGGTTANSGEVWARGSLFPSETQKHLRSMPQLYAPNFTPGDLSIEHYAAMFFRSNYVPGFDRQFPWFRWQTRLTAQEITTNIDANIGARQAANMFMVQVLCAAGEPTNEPVRTIGQLTNLEVVRRGQGGNIMELIFTGTDATVRVQTEFNIRTLLSPSKVTRHDGSYVTNLTLLPSAFFTMEAETDANGNLVAVTLFGGGNGHGVGMSQNGVRALVDRGLCYREILRHFYPGVDVKQFSVGD